MENKVLENARKRVGEIDDILAGYAGLVEEKEQLLSLIGFYERQGNPAIRVLESVPKDTRKHGGKAVLFQPKPSGPTERILSVLKASPGLTYSQVVNRAAEGLESAADDPRKSAASTLQSLVSRGRIERRDGKHYLAEGA